jgi:hypothetical protein
MGKKPNISNFREVLRKTGGNISKVADTFKVSRKSVYDWAKDDSKFKDAISDERGSLVDECLISARVLALGIPEKDEKGNFVGWRERPDGYMIRYLLSTLGRYEGFGDEPQKDDDIPTDIDEGVRIEAWIENQIKQRRTQE